MSAHSGGSARGYQALSKLSAVGESRMPRADPAFLDPLTDPHPPIGPAAFSEPDTVAVLTARLLPAPRRILTPIDRQGARTLMRLPVKCVGPCGMKFGLPAGWKSMLARPLS